MNKYRAMNNKYIEEMQALLCDNNFHVIGNCHFIHSRSKSELFIVSNISIVK